MNTYRGLRNVRNTPQSQPIPGSTQVANSAGGFGWQVDDWAKLDRFLILGTQGGTYYIAEKKLTQDNADAVERCIKSDGLRTVARIVEISTAGRAAKNDPAVFALAMCMTYGDAATKVAVREALPHVCRIGTHLFHFGAYVNEMRGWGRSLRRAVADWYGTKSIERLSEQLVKYQQRDGWSHADLLRLSHARATGLRAQLYAYAGMDKAFSKSDVRAPAFEAVTAGAEVLYGFEHAQALHADTVANCNELVQLIIDFNLTREMVPTWALNHAEVWNALLAEMPMEAMVRNLGNLSKVGLLTPLSAAATLVTSRLADAERIRRARVHPLKLLTALRVYQSGKGVRGQSKWDVTGSVVDALDAAFYLAFKNVEPTGKNVMLALDVSSSMTMGQVAGLPLTPREASAALALVTANVEPYYVIAGFTSPNGISSGRRGDIDGFSLLDISPKQRLDDVIKRLDALPFGGTDCALPMLYASKHKLELDAFVIYTDSETWAGTPHPTQALQEYRNRQSRRAKLVTVGMVSNGFSIADPNDAGQLDVVGFDTDTPDLISGFIRE